MSTLAPDPPRRSRRRGAHRRERGQVTLPTVALVLTGLDLVATIALGLPGTLLALRELLSENDPQPAPTQIVCNGCVFQDGVTDVTPQTNATAGGASTVQGGGGPTKVHPSPAPEGPDRKESKMSIYQGAHVIAEFPDATVEAIVLEVRGSEALVQQKGTRRAEWIPVAWLR